MAASKSKLTREEAEEYTHNLGQITAGDYGLIDFAVTTLRVPDALGLTTEEWVQEHLGGYVRWTVEARRKAVAQLSADGKRNTEIGQILGISPATAARDLAVLALDSTQVELTTGEEARNSTQVASKLTPAEKKVAIRRLLEEGKTDAEVALALGCGVSTVSKERTALKQEAARQESERKLREVQAKRDANAVTVADQKAHDAYMADTLGQLETNVTAAFASSPAETLQMAKEDLAQVMKLDIAFDVDNCVALWVEIGNELWVAGAKVGADVSRIVQTFNKLEGGE